ncbi:UPF0481 protein family [Quillaja saponaria]|uniref:UPF0481 protein family n=1 Tax=Quillaja saponaria TaxID=32244 RepID=A0AAD7M3W6_QUISA|nr:UPF0481 protein family [Quillaja saponaria]
MRKELNSKSSFPNESETVCTYRVPAHMWQEELETYKPSYISIGPYLHGQQHLQALEKLNFIFYCSLLSCQWSQFKHHFGCTGKHEGVFLELLLGRQDPESIRRKSKQAYFFPQKIDAPKSQQSVGKLIMLENQLPQSVFCKLFELMGIPQTQERSQEEPNHIQFAGLFEAQLSSCA